MRKRNRSKTVLVTSGMSNLCDLQTSKVSKPWPGALFLAALLGPTPFTLSP